MKLLADVSADTVSAVSAQGDGSKVYVSVAADSFGGGRVILEVQAPGETRWAPIRISSDLSPRPIIEVTGNDIVVIDLPPGHKLRARLVGSVNASNVTVIAQG